MKTKIYIGLILLFGAMLQSGTLFAQDDLQIGKVFEKYGHRKNVVMVELSEDILQSFSLTLYKSISIKDDPSAADYIRRCVRKDQEGAKKIKIVIKSGDLSSAYLQLAKKGKENRFILFKSEEEDEVTLIYIETTLDTDNIVNLLLKKGQ
ncbi:MAG: DUF6108 family protein [Bacteroidales bacterium]|nr:DUF6108 family protein [Bacteroidales bacterium]